MAASILKVLAEEVRQGLTGDTNYNKSLPWVFKLAVEGESFVGPTGADGTALFPLPMAPEKFDYDLPFAGQATPQQEGGVVAEEAGIVLGSISMSGTTGFKLRGVDTLTFAQADPVFTSDLASNGVGAAVSGQYHFWLLANRCFEGYSELKKNPALASKTRMELHILKENLHLEVMPVSFRLVRGGNHRVTYGYEIKLTVLGAAAPIYYESPSTKSFFDDLKDGLAKLRAAVQSIAALIQDITSAVGEIARFISSIPSILSDLGSIIDAATALVEGTKSFLDFPSAMIANLQSLLESVAVLAENVAEWPADVAESFLRINDEVDAMKVAVRNKFRQTEESVSERYNQLSNSNRFPPENISSHQQSLIDKAADDASDGGLTLDQVFGGGFKPGDKARQLAAKDGDRMSQKGYSGFDERVVGQGDTLQSLAAKYLLDPARWIDLAAVNGLRAPYITTRAKIPNTLQIGSKISIPRLKSSPVSRVMSGTADTDESLFGVDVELEALSSGRYGWRIDTAHGAVDAQLVRGVDNVSQAIGVRLRTERGQNVIYPSVGLPRQVGLKSFGAGEAILALRQQIASDPRVQKILGLRFSLVQDALTLEASVQLVGSQVPRAISRTL